MKSNKLILSLSLLAFSSTTFAMLCPTNFSTIDIGDTIEKVQLLCGDPNSYKKFLTRESQPQEWEYYIKVKPSDTGTLKMTIAFNNDKVVNMSVNGIGVTWTKICGSPIQVGNDQSIIKKACGEPVFVNQGSKALSGDAAKVTEVYEITYNVNPPITLIFVNGRLKERKM